MQQLSEEDKVRFVYKDSAAQDDWAYELWEKHEELHWLPKEVPMKDDVTDWANHLTTEDKNFITSVLGFFVQADIEVHDTYIHDYLPHYNTLGVKTMLTGFSAREPVHVMGYAYGIETLLQGSAQRAVFEKFLNNENLMKLHNALDKYRGEADAESRYKHMIATTLFGEGVMLFGQFAMLLNYARNGRLRGLGQIVSWSIRDEDTHVYGVTQLMKRDGRFAGLDKVHLFEEVSQEIKPLLVQFVKDCFEGYGSDTCITQRITLEETLQFLEYQIQRRARQAHITDAPITVQNPFEWFDVMVGGVEHGNFFEVRTTEYAKGNVVGEYDY